MKDDDKRRGSRLIKTLSAVVVVALVAALLWGSDRITLQGERTVYTVGCDHGTWSGNLCSGKLVPDKRYAFRASPSRHEVIYWVRGTGAPSDKYADCEVTDRDNWSCKPKAGTAPTTIAYEMIKGKPTRVDSSLVLPFHSVPKWKWWLMDAGLRIFSEAGD
ncbi:MAG: hypothetical protein ABI569_05615 [Casimicrobiaceae bacterium]